jgi:hypothetical protein
MTKQSPNSRFLMRMKNTEWRIKKGNKYCWRALIVFRCRFENWVNLNFRFNDPHSRLLLLTFWFWMLDSCPNFWIFQFYFLHYVHLLSCFLILSTEFCVPDYISAFFSYFSTSKRLYVFRLTFHVSLLTFHVYFLKNYIISLFLQCTLSSVATAVCGVSPKATSRASDSF